MKKIVSAAMASVFLFGSLISFAGCKGKVKREHEVISATDKWYSCTEFDAASKCNALNYNNYHFWAPVVIGDKVVVTYMTRYASLIPKAIF